MTMKSVGISKTDEFREFIVGEDHPCVMAQMVFKQEHVIIREYNKLGDVTASASLLQDLEEYLSKSVEKPGHFYSFIALFENEDFTQLKFERRLWQQLQKLHELDSEEWDSTVSANPDDNNFSFSLLGQAFYIVGMHPESSRMARQSPCPALVFNLHSQFEHLRKLDAYEKTKEHIRERDYNLQGSINPMLEDFGGASEARQYSGREVRESWKCPFHSKHKIQ